MAYKRVTVQDIADACSLSRNTVSRVFNDRGAVPEETRAKVTDIWGVGEDDEMQGVWRPTGQDGLWVMGGNMFLARQNARPLALQIVAAESTAATPAGAPS